MTDLLAIVIVGLGTYTSRSVFIISLANRRIPDPILVSLQFVAPAVLSALIVALLIDDRGEVVIGVPELSAFVAGATVAQRTRNHVWTLGAGMCAFWLLGAIREEITAPTARQLELWRVYLDALAAGGLDEPSHGVPPRALLRTRHRQCGNSDDGAGIRPRGWPNLYRTRGAGVPRPGATTGHSTPNWPWLQIGGAVGLATLLTVADTTATTPGTGLSAAAWVGGAATIAAAVLALALRSPHQPMPNDGHDSAAPSARG
jgi:branched-subunit amino acid transport protein